MKKLLLFLTFLLNSCYLTEKKKDKYAVLDLQVDPILKLEETDLIYIDESTLTDEIENRRIVHYFKNALNEKGYKLTTNKKQAQVTVNIEKAPRTFTFHDTKRIITEETTVKKKVYIKEKDTFEEEPKTTTKYKEVPYEYSRTYVNIKFSFNKIKDNKSINIIKTYIEENEPGDFKNLLEKFIYKLVDCISLNEEIRHKLIFCNETEGN